MESYTSSEETDGEQIESKSPNRDQIQARLEIEQDVFRCETQMINTYVRQEVKDPVTHKVVKVLHTFSFCNHADLPDDVLEDVIKESWKDLFALTGPQDSSLAAEWPDRINIVEDQVPGGIDELFPQSGESEDTCRHCNSVGLQGLTKHHLKKELGMRGCEIKKDFKTD